MKTKKKNTSTPSAPPPAPAGLVLDPALATGDAPGVEAESFEIVLELLDGVPVVEVRIRNVAPEAIHRASLDLAELLATPDIAARMAPLAPHFLPIGAVDTLARLGHAAEWIRLRRLDAEALSVPNAIGDAVLAEAEALRETMVAVVLHNAKSRPGVPELVGSITAGKGYEDLADDLERLAKLYGVHHDLVKNDGNHYDPGHPKRALELQKSIRIGLQKGVTEAGRWNDLANRLFTAVVPRFERLHDAAWFALHGDPRRDSLRTLHSYNTPKPARPARPADEAADAKKETVDAKLAVGAEGAAPPADGATTGATTGAGLEGGAVSPAPATDGATGPTEAPAGGAAPAEAPVGDG